MELVIFKSNRKSFTLIELLVVIFIIIVVALIVLTVTTRARADGRDAKRKADLDAIKTAVEMYYDKNRTYIITDPEGNPAGNTWSEWSLFNCAFDPAYSTRATNYTQVSIAQALEEWGFLNPAPVPPGFDITDRTGGSKDVCNMSSGVVTNKYFHRDYKSPTKYIYMADKDRYSIYAGLENPNFNNNLDQEFIYTNAGDHGAGYCDGVQPTEDPDNPWDDPNCYLPAPSAPNCVCHCTWDSESSTSGACPDENQGWYMKLWSNYRVGNGK